MQDREYYIQRSWPLKCLLGLFFLVQILPYNHAQSIEIKPSSSSGETLAVNLEQMLENATLFLNGEEVESKDSSNSYLLSPDLLSTSRAGKLYFIKAESETETVKELFHITVEEKGPRVRRIPLWFSIIPPFIAIALALVFKEVLISLFAGIWAGAFIAGGLRFESLYYYFKSFGDVISKYILESLNNAGHLSVILFSLLLGGMVAIISRNGGMAGVVESLSRYAKSRRSAQFITWLLGIAIFFDDYANTLIVGNTMRPVTDKFKVSREKLAYIVDSTAAPIASVALITTWIGAELGYIDSGIQSIEGFGDGYTTYSLFLYSLKYSFYPLFALALLFFVIYLQKDFGPMLKSEQRAESTGQVSPAKTEEEDEPDMEDISPVENVKLHWSNAVIPILVVLFTTIFGLFVTGMESIAEQTREQSNAIFSTGWLETWKSIPVLFEESPGFFQKLGLIVGSADSYVALLWASLSGVFVAIALTLGKRIMPIKNIMHVMTTGFKTMLPAVLILTLAWGLALTTEELKTAEYLTSILEGNLNPYLFPALIFLLSAIISFSTGSSWSTMAILYPIAIPTSWYLSQSAGLDIELSTELILNVIATILAASVLGDHCSPISDTTILSSLASDCNHIDHVRTQLPYALLAGGFAFSCVLLSSYLGGGFFNNVVLAVIVLTLIWGIVKYFGKSVKV